MTGHQWWWEVRYQDPVPSRIVTTANEIHMPVGGPVRLDAALADVIHSFWVPNLHGKRDLIPGQINDDLDHAPIGRACIAASAPSSAASSTPTWRST